MTQILRETKYHLVIMVARFLWEVKNPQTCVLAPKISRKSQKIKNQNVWTLHVDFWSSKQNRHDKLTPRKMTINLMPLYLRLMIGSIFEIPYAQKVRKVFASWHLNE